jgi:hypothetical protein
MKSACQPSFSPASVTASINLFAPDQHDISALEVQINSKASWVYSAAALEKIVVGVLLV